jgi:hypothetical protein
MSAEARCGCGVVGKPMRECIECGHKVCEKCAVGWVGNVCRLCQADNPVFFDTHPRTHGAVDPQKGV